MFLLYSCMPVVVRLTSATAVNLSLLTADLFSLFCGIFLFKYTVSNALQLGWVGRPWIDTPHSGVKLTSELAFEILPVTYSVFTLLY